MTQIASGTETPIVHTVEVIDWLTGGPKPIKLNNYEKKNINYSKTFKRK